MKYYEVADRETGEVITNGRFDSKEEAREELEAIAKETGTATYELEIIEF